MKNLYLLVCILAAGLLFTSCKKENKESTPENSIMGKWKGDKMINTMRSNGLVLGSDTSFWKAPDYLNIEFKKNNVMVLNEFSDNELDNEELYYKVVGDKLIIMETADDLYPEDYTFKVNGKKLILSRSDTGVEGGVTWKLDSELHFIR